jgi:acetylglutamate kinase
MIRVVKIGGNVIDDEQTLCRFLDLFVQLPSPKVLVHGGGKLATRLCEQLDIKTQMIDGRRVTNKETLDVVTMVYAGLVNKHIVAMLQARGQQAIGLSGADANLIPAHKRPAEPIDYGFVGDIEQEGVNVPFLKSLLEQGITPVVCPLTHDRQGSMLNTNADSIASAIAVAASQIDETQLVYCFEKQGVLRDVDDPESVIPLIQAENYEQLKADGIISKGMLPKIASSLKAIENGVGSVVIKHADNLLENKGTTIK